MKLLIRSLMGVVLVLFLGAWQSVELSDAPQVLSVIEAEDGSEHAADILRLYLDARVLEEADRRVKGVLEDPLFFPSHQYLLSFIGPHSGKKVVLSWENFLFEDIIAAIARTYGRVLYCPEPWDGFEEETFSLVSTEPKDCEGAMRILEEVLNKKGYTIYPEGYYLRVASQAVDREGYQEVLLKMFTVGKELYDEQHSDPVKAPTVIQEATEDDREEDNETPMDDSLTLQFQNASIDSVLQFFSDISKYTIVKHPKVQGSITLMSLTPVSLDSALNILKKALVTYGYVLRQDDTLKTITVFPREAISNKKTKVLDSKDGSGTMELESDDLVTKVIKLQYGNTMEVANAIASMVSHGGSVVPYPKANTLILNDDYANIQRLSKIVQELDENRTELKTKVISIKHTSPMQIVGILENIGRSYINDQERFSVAGDDRTRAIFVTGFPGGIERAEKLVAVLDRAATRILCEITLVRVPYTVSEMPVKYRLFSSFSGQDTLGKGAPRKQFLLDWHGTGTAGDGTSFSWCGLSSVENKDSFLRTLESFYGVKNVSVVHAPLVTMNENEEFYVDFSSDPFFEEVLSSGAMAFKLFPTITAEKDVLLDAHQKVAIGDTLTRESFLQVVVQSRQTMVWGGLHNNHVTVERRGEALFPEAKGKAMAEVAALPPFLEALPEQYGGKYFQYLVFVTPLVLFDDEVLGNYFHDGSSTMDDVLLEKSSGEVDLSALFPEGFEEYGKGMAPSIESPLPVVPGTSTVEAAPLVEEATQESSDEEGTKGTPGPLKHVMPQMDADLQVLTPIVPERVGSLADDLLEDKDGLPLVTALEEGESIYGGSGSAEVFSPGEKRTSSMLDGYILKETLYRRGVSFYDEGRYKEAIQEFAPILSIDPFYKDVKSYIKLARRKFQEGVKGARKLRQESVGEEMVQTTETMQQRYQAMRTTQGAGEVYEDASDIGLKRRVVQKKRSRIAAAVVDVSADHPLVIVDRGAQDGLTEGMIFRVYRQDIFVGKIVLTDIESSVAAARVIAYEEEHAIQVGDAAVMVEM